jgi:lipid A 3-O-deacylase
MSRWLSPTLFGLCLLGLTAPVYAQLPAPPAPFASSHDSVSHMIRFYEDDDCINIWFDGTDDAYSNGTRIDYFYQPTRPSHFFLNRWMPGAGDSSIDIYGWGAMQIMYTPDNIINPNYQPNDYPWSGALIGTHTRYSYNPEKCFDLQTEMVLGVIGPAALDRQTQSLVHNIIQYYHPTGWSNQFSNDLLLNVNFTAEKQLIALGSVVNIIGGAQVYTGTMQNGAALYPLLLIGKMNPYFQGFFRQNTSPGREDGRQRWQLYFFAKPELQWFLSNALLQGGLFISNPSYHPLQNWVPSFTYGMSASCGRWGFSGSQIISAATLRGLYCHNYGNVSLFYAW